VEKHRTGSREEWLRARLDEEYVFDHASYR
jgi:hypothetical protein